MPPRPLLLSLLLASALGCNDTGPPRTQLQAWVDADPAVKDAMEVLDIQVYVGRDDSWELRTDWPQEVGEGFIWPVALTVVARPEDLGSLVEIRSGARRPNRVLTRTRAVAAFEDAQSLRLQLQLQESCQLLGTICEDADCFGPECITCRDGECGRAGLENDLPQAPPEAEGRLVD